MFRKQEYEVFILTAYPTKHAINDKNFNLDSTFGKEILPLSHRIFVPYGDNKADYIMQFDGDKNILIDDYNPNLECWNGIAIKFLNGVNGGSNEWQGHQISRNMTGREIVQEVQRISDMYVPIQIEKEKTISSYQQKIIDHISKTSKTTNKNIDRD